MHKFAEEIMECVKTKVKGVGIDNIDRECADELETWCSIADKICRYDYHYKIIEAMEKAEKEGAEYGEDYDYRGRKPYTRMRDGMGRYMRGYEEPMRYDWDRDDGMDSTRYSDYQHGKMHYTEPMNKQELMDNVEHIKKNVTDMMAEMTQAERDELKMKMKNISNML